MSHEYTIKDLIDAALRKYNFDDSISRNRVEEAYRDVVGPFIVQLTRSVSYNASTHTLKVVLSVPALKNELTYKTTDLINAINQKLGHEEVKDLYLLWVWVNYCFLSSFGVFRDCRIAAAKRHGGGCCSGC